MKKKGFDEFGVLVTREMLSMLLDENISYEDRARIMCAIIAGEELENPMMKAFADSLRTGYETTNAKRINEIIARRERQLKYQRNLRSSMVDKECASTVDEHQSTRRVVDERASPSKLNYIKLDNTPYNPPLGDGDCPPVVSPEDILGKNPAEQLAEEIEQTEAFAHMRVNRRKLLRALRGQLQKNGAAVILEGIKKWTEAWEKDNWRYAPGSIAQWLDDGKYLQEPRVEEIKERHEEIGVKEIV